MKNIEKIDVLNKKCIEETLKKTHKKASNKKLREKYINKADGFVKQFGKIFRIVD